eukprot:m.133098 g.133098  ORF g.133098 m.133098 type:complete len:524 (+) comp23798_c0_seq1:76-1647(+)
MLLHCVGGPPRRMLMFSYSRLHVLSCAFHRDASQPPPQRNFSTSPPVSFIGKKSIFSQLLTKKHSPISLPSSSTQGKSSLTSSILSLLLRAGFEIAFALIRDSFKAKPSTTIAKHSRTSYRTYHRDGEFVVDVVFDIIRLVYYIFRYPYRRRGYQKSKSLVSSTSDQSIANTNQEHQGQSITTTTTTASIEPSPQNASDISQLSLFQKPRPVQTPTKTFSSPSPPDFPFIQGGGRSSSTAYSGSQWVAEEQPVPQNAEYKQHTILRAESQFCDVAAGSIFPFWGLDRNSVVFSNYLDRQLLLLDVQTGQVTSRFASIQNPTSVAICNGNIAVVDDDAQVVVLDTSGTEHGRWNIGDHGNGEVGLIAIDSLGNWAAHDREHKTLWYSPRHGTPRQVRKGRGLAVTNLCFAKDGRLLVCTGKAYSVWRPWDPQTDSFGSSLNIYCPYNDAMSACPQTGDLFVGTARGIERHCVTADQGWDPAGDAYVKLSLQFGTNFFAVHASDKYVIAAQKQKLGDYKLHRFER